MNIIMKIVLLIIIILVALITYLTWSNYFFTTPNYKILFIVFIIIVWWLILLIIINSFFEKPLKNIVYNIKKFLVWWLKEEEITINKTLNIDVNYLSSFFKRTLSTLKNIKSDFIHWKEIKSEVELWKEIQVKLLEKKQITIPSIDIIAKSKPAREIWWDSFDIIKQWDNYYIYVWDATWHWVWAWFIMMMVNALISGFSEIFKSWSEILIYTNKIIKPRVKANLLMSLLLLRWEEKEKRLFMTWAWHEHLLIYKNKQKKCFKIKSDGVALWMTKDISKIVRDKELKIEIDDIIVLYSDWITEAINKPVKDWTEEMFWEKRLMQAITNTPDEKLENYKTVTSVFNNITIELSKFMWYKHVQLDDITLIVLQYKDFTSNSDIQNDKKQEIINKEFITEWNW